MSDNRRDLNKLKQLVWEKWHEAVSNIRLQIINENEAILMTDRNTLETYNQQLMEITKIYMIMRVKAIIREKEEER